MNKLNKKTIKIHLYQGSVTGLRHIEMLSWTGQAVACPRSQLTHLQKEWPECDRPGVYFLFGVDDNNLPMVYIGEAENVSARVLQHNKTKDYWEEMVAFTSKDENLTKSHVKYLEHRLLTMASEIARYSIQNSSNPNSPVLPRSDKADMEDFIDKIRVLLGVLGYKVLEPILESETLSAVKTNLNDLYELKAKGITATALRTNEGMVVLAQSQAVTKVLFSCSGGNQKLRSQLVEKAILVPEGNYFVFTKDYLFASPSQAAAVILGSSVNGRDAWKNQSGKSLKTVELEKIE